MSSARGGDARLVAGLGVTAAIGLVVCGPGAVPLRPIMMWQDRRALREADALVARYGRNGLFATSGRPIDPELAACKLAWLVKHEPRTASRISTAYTLKDWLVHRLCGECVTDATSASYSLVYDVFARRWNRELIDELGLNVGWMPPVAAAGDAAGTTTRHAADDLGLRAGIPVAVGGPDGTMGALGAGMIEPASAVDVIGTTDVVFTVTDRPLEDTTRRTITNAYVDSQRWAIGGPLALTGGALRWFVDEFGPLQAPGAASAFAALDALANGIAPGADGLVFFPGLAGERVPWWQPQTRAANVGEGVASAVRVARVVEPDMAVHARYRELRAVMAELRPHVDRASQALQSHAA